MDQWLSLQIFEAGADEERLDALVGYLRAELLELDIVDLAKPPGHDLPLGARGAVADADAAGGLLVALGQSMQSLRSVVVAVSAWLRRSDNSQRTVRLELGGDVLELARASSDEQKRLVELFISQHTPQDSG
jgi:hypothetical protein